MISFPQKPTAALKPLPDQLRHDTEVSAHSQSAIVIFDRHAGRVLRIVGHRKWMDEQVADAVLMPRLEELRMSQLADLHGKVFQGAAAAIDGQVEAPAW